MRDPCLPEPYQSLLDDENYQACGDKLAQDAVGLLFNMQIPQLISMQPLLEQLFVTQYGLPIYVGEFGAFRWAPGTNAYLSDLIGLFEENGWNWAYYVWRSNELAFNGFDMELGTDQSNY
jgi:hypothetical protein